jgi:hypothetical protein
MIFERSIEMKTFSPAFGSILFLLFLVFVVPSWAATYTANSCSRADVQSAINSARDGDTVQVPACPGGVTWATGITVDLSSGKALTLQGAGTKSNPDQTVITDGTNSSTPAISVKAASGKLFRLSGFTFQGGAGDVLIRFAGSPSKIRIDNNKFHNLAYRVAFVYSTWGDVLFDNNIWDGNVYAGIILVGGDTDYSWRQPVNWGGSDFIFFEDNTFNYSIANNEGVDCYNGGKFVFRYNTVINTLVSNHGFDSSTRACMAMEIYGNNFSNPAGGVWPGAVQMRGGTALIYDNTFQASLSGVWVTNYRKAGR